MEAIEKAFEKVYPGITPKFFMNTHPWRLGGSEPLDYIYVYDCGEWLHFVSMGLSDLYEKESNDTETSGFGMEFTFRLKKSCCLDEAAEIQTVCQNMMNIAKFTFNDGELFMPYEWIYTGQTTGIDNRQVSELTGLILVPDARVSEITTPFGRVQFVEMVGAAHRELLALENESITVEELYARIGTDMTDYNRRSVV